MHATAGRTVLLIGGCCLVLALAACGGSPSSRPDDPEPQGRAKQGGSVTFLSAGDVDYLDPGQTYYAFAYILHYAVNRTLYSYGPTDPETPRPDLAAAPPEVAPGNRTITVRLRRGVRYAPPVDREVVAQDVKYAIERAFTTNVPSGYATSYFAEIEGAPAQPVPIDRLEPFSGLRTPDDHTLVIELRRPVGQRVAAALVMPITTPVPEEYARRFDRRSPSEYDRYVAFTGPYMVRHDLETGELTGRTPGKRIELVRNPSWDPSTDHRPAYLDSITFQAGNADTVVAARRTLAGRGLLCCDTTQPPASVLRQALTRHRDQLGRVPSGGTLWISLNTAVPPFDNLNVRRAVVAGFDREGLRATSGGAAAGAVAQGYIPPGVTGYEESGAEEGFTDLDFMQAPQGDPAVATRYFEAAADEGVPVEDGRYAGDEELLMVAPNAEPGLKTAQVAQEEFERLGFDVRFRQVPADALFTRFCGVPKLEVAICAPVGWFKDFTDPESMLQPTFAGSAIKPVGNVNWSQLSVPEIDAAMEEAALLPAGRERTEAWTEVNRMVVAQAPAIPFVWGDAFQLASADVRGVMNPYTTGWDLAYTSMR